MVDDSEHHDPPDPADDGSVLLPFDGEIDDDGEGGLELDDRQAEEIQQVFLTTLPQYLEPVAEMVDQLLADGVAGKLETHHALRATLSSLSDAASRIGVSAVYDLLGRMNRTVAAIDPAQAVVPAELSDRIRADLDQIGQIAGRPDNAEGGPQPTLFAALRGITGVDEGVLSRLTAAGLVTVEQLRGAELDEVVAVTGLTAEVAERVLGAVSPQPAGEARVVELPLEGDALRLQLQHKLRAQVEAEAALDEVKDEVQRLRARTAAAVEELQAAEARLDQLERELVEAGDVLGERVAGLANARADRTESSRRRADALAALAREEEQLAALRDELAAMAAAEDRFGEGVEGLVAEVERMLEAALRW